jgi:hypothetical protein
MDAQVNRRIANITGHLVASDGLPLLHVIYVLLNLTETGSKDLRSNFYCC